jgi:N6-adenosine-specific RNA methylase IME4
LKELIPFPDKKYRCIAADPPWKYKNVKTGGTMKSGAAAKYPLMTLEEIADLPVKDIADKNCILFLWVPVPLKVDIARSDILKKWGFTYKTTLFWRKKNRNGIGYWYRGVVEENWLCVRGKVTAFRCQKPNIIESIPRIHSQKPEEFFELNEPEIEKYNLNPRIELFSRARRPKWDAWGFDVTSEENKRE